MTKCKFPSVLFVIDQKVRAHVSPLRSGGLSNNAIKIIIAANDYFLTELCNERAYFFYNAIYSAKFMAPLDF